MYIYLTSSDFPGIDNATELIAELGTHLSLHFPCLEALPPDRVEELTSVLRPVIRRWGEVGTGADGGWVAGPFRAGTGPVRKDGAHTLEPIEAASLRALCGSPRKVAGLPMVSSPEVEPIADLFVRRPGWPAPAGGRW